MQRIIDSCKENNKTVDLMLSNGELSLSDFVKGQFSENNTKDCSNKKNDLIDLCITYVKERGLTETQINSVRQILKSGQMITADHLGGLYSAQSFQGDLLFYHMLKSKGFDTACVPIFTFGLVTMTNSTYPRGIILYEKQKEPLHLALIGDKYYAMLATCMPAFTEVDVKKLIKNCNSKVNDLYLKEYMLDYINDYYLQDDILKYNRYAEQIVRIGDSVYKQFLGNDSVVFIEPETIFSKLLLKDLNDTDSLVHRFFYDKDVINALTGYELYDSILLGIDEKCVKFPMTISTDGKIYGYTRRNEKIEFNIDELEDRLNKSEVIPSTYLDSLMLIWERGFTWYGGIFQNLYLKDWQSETAQLLNNAGINDLVAKIKCHNNNSAYISGPIYACSSGVDNSLVNAGIIEMLYHNKKYDDIKGLYDTTTVYDAHILGMYEFYNDLVRSKDKFDDWYEVYSRYAFENYCKNKI